MVVPPTPSRSAVVTKLRALIGDETLREDTADWAGQWVYAHLSGVEDRAVWHALLDLVKVDVETEPGTYLYSIADFESWLDELCSSAPTSSTSESGGD